MQYFRAKYGVDVSKRYAAKLGELEAEGYFSTDGDDIVVSRGGMLQIDRLLHRFFLAEHCDARYT